MASRTQLAELRPPSLGLRLDIDARAMPPEALAIAKNVLNVDGAIVPRPAHALVPVTYPWREVWSGSAQGMARQPHGVLAIGCSNSIVYSRDLLDWETYDLGTGSETLPVLLCHPQRPWWYAFGALSDVYRAMPTWPGKASFSNVGKVSAAAVSMIGAAMNPATGYILATIVNSSSNTTARHCENPEDTTPTWTSVLTKAVVGSDAYRVCCCAGNWVLVAGSGSIQVAADKSGLAGGDFSQVGPGGSLEFVAVASDEVSMVAAVCTVTVGGEDLVKVYASLNAGSTWSEKASTVVAAGDYAVNIVHVQGAEFLVFTLNATYMVHVVDRVVVAHEALPYPGPPSMPTVALSALTLPSGHVVAVGEGRGVYSHQPWGSRPTALVQYDGDDERRLVVRASERAVERLDQEAAEWHDLTPGDMVLAGKAPEAQMVWRTFERGGKTYLLGTNGVDFPIVYHPGDTYARVMVGAPVARCMAVAHNRVLLGALRSGGTVSEQAVDTSAFLNFDAGWGTVQVSLLGDLPGGIVTMAEISALQVAIYMEDAIHHAIAQAEFLGVAAPFRFELVSSGIQGPCSPAAVARVEGVQTFLGRDGGVYLHEGAGPPRDVGPHLRALIQPQFNDTRPDGAWLMYDKYHHLLWGFYPHITNGMSQGFVLVTDRGWPWPLYEVTLPGTWEAVCGMPGMLRDALTIGDLVDPVGELDTSIGSWVDYSSEMLTCLLDGSLVKQKREDDGDYSDNGTAIACDWRTGLNPLGQRMHFKTVHETHEQLQGLEDGEAAAVTVYGVDEMGAEVASGPRTLTNATRYFKASHRLTERLFAHRVTMSVSRFFRWHGSDILYSYRGRR